MSEEKNKPSLKSQSAWLMFAKTAGYVLSALLPLLIFRKLEQSQAGIYKQVFQVIANATGILPFGFSMSAYYFLSRETLRRPFFIFNILLFNFVVGGLACLSLFLFPQILEQITQDAQMKQLAPHIGVVIWLWIFSMFLETVAVANQEPRIATLFIIFAQFTKTLLLGSAVFIFGTVESFLWAATIQAIIQTGVLIYYLQSRFAGFWHSFNVAYFREHLVYAIPFGLIAILWVLQSEIHNYFIMYRFSSAEYAIYAAGVYDLPLLYVLFESVNSVLIPRMSELQSQGKRREMIELMMRAIQKLSLFHFPIAVFLFIVAESFIITLFGRNFSQSVPLFQTCAILVAFYIFPTDSIVRAFTELGRITLILRILIFVGLLTALSFGINNFDLQGMVWIVVITALVERFLSTALVAWKMKVKKEDLGLLKNVFLAGVISLFAGFIAYLLHLEIKVMIPQAVNGVLQMVFEKPLVWTSEFLSGGLIIGLTALIFAPIYLFGVYYFGVIEAEEKETINNMISRLRLFFGKEASPAEGQ